MPKFRKHTKGNIVSVRVSDEERETLKKVSRASNKKVSDLMREALQDMVPRQTSP